MILIQRFKLKAFWFLIILIPLGYIFSIYRHLRGLLFIEGIPDFNRLMELIINIISEEPPDIKNLLLSISESVNVNVIFEIFKYTTLNTFLHGETFLKPFVFFIPRSI